VHDRSLVLPLIIFEVESPGVHPLDRAQRQQALLQQRRLFRAQRLGQLDAQDGAGSYPRRDRGLADLHAQLAQRGQRFAHGLTVVPYVDGQPARLFVAAQARFPAMQRDQREQDQQHRQDGQAAQARADRAAKGMSGKGAPAPRPGALVTLVAVFAISQRSARHGTPSAGATRTQRAKNVLPFSVWSCTPSGNKKAPSPQ